MSQLEFGAALLHLKVLEHLACTFLLIHNYTLLVVFFFNRYAVKWNDNRI